jgi:hypothetical protein
MGLDHLPLWGLYLATTAAVLVAVEMGFRLGRYRHSIGAAEKEGPVGAMVGATLALLAFLLTFTFGVAASRFEARRQALLDEVNAIGTTYLRAGLLPDPHRTEIERLLRDYVATRISGANADRVQGAIAQSEAIHTQLWSHVAKVAALDSKSIITGLFIQTLNDTIDMHATRIHALRSRIPGAVWAMLMLVTMMAMTATGYHEGLSSTRRTPVILALVLAFSGVVALIADLDRPHEGLLRVSQQSMIDLKRGMAAPSP